MHLPWFLIWQRSCWFIESKTEGIDCGGGRSCKLRQELSSVHMCCRGCDGLWITLLKLIECNSTCSRCAEVYLELILLNPSCVGDEAAGIISACLPVGRRWAGALAEMSGGGCWRYPRLHMMLVQPSSKTPNLLPHLDHILTLYDNAMALKSLHYNLKHYLIVHI